LPPIGASDHECLKWDLYCSTTRKNLDDKKSYNYFKGDYYSLNSYFNEINWSEEFKEHDINYNTNFFVQTLSSAVNLFVPKVNKRRSDTKPPWWSKKLTKAINQKRSFYIKWRTTRTTTDHKCYVKKRNEVKALIRSSQSKYEEKLIQKSSLHPKLLYGYLRRKQKFKPDISQLEKPDGSMSSSDTETAEVLNNFFKSTFTTEDPNNIPIIATRVFDSLSNISLSEDIVFRKLLSLNGSKAPGPDNIHPHLLKSCASTLAKPVFLLAQQSLSSGVLPDIWKKAHVTPIFKKGCKSQATNYRPISLTSQVVKLIETCIREQLWEFLIKHKALNPHQHGFTKHKSCFTNLLESHNNWTKAIDDRHSVDIIYLDYSKAFDSVPHLRLLSKLQAYGIQGNLLKWIRNFLIGRQQKVVLNQHSSQWTNVSSGVPQGSVLGPLLFLLYVNDITDCIQSTMEMFADDSKLYRVIKDPHDIAILQQDLNLISDWSRLWLLQFNISKCSVMHLGKGDNAVYTLFDHNINAHSPLQPTMEQKDLGIWITPSMNFSLQCQKASNKANQTLGRLKRSFKYMSRQSLTTLYKTFVRPHLEYCASIWSPHLARDIDTLEKVQRRATKLVPSISTLSYELRLNALNLYSLYCRRQRGDLIEVYKILNDLYYVNQHDFFTVDNSSTTRGHSKKLFKPRAITTTRLHFFSYRVISSWNSLPQHVITANSTSNFKFKLDKFWSSTGHGHNQRPPAY